MTNLYTIRSKDTLLWWLACSVAVWPLSVVVGLVAAIPFIIFGNFISQIVFIGDLWLWGLLPLVWLSLVIGFSVGHLQRWLLRKRFYWVAPYWRTATVIGSAIGVALVTLGRWLYLEGLSSPIYTSDISWLRYAMPTLLASISIAQMWILRRAVKRAWLWVLANVTSGVAFGSLFAAGLWADSRFLAMSWWIPAGLALGLATGVVMLFLFKHHLRPLEPDDNKNAAPETRSVWDQAI